MTTTVPLRWVKSSYSNNGGACVEVATLPGAVAVRDSKNPQGPRLTLTRDGFAGLVQLAKHTA
ncbi:MULTISPECIES: DUF397 domain-containing protein [unclassified Streptomyces]|uniref:DUF397 domain-containing protein n=1 Tax=unclassified Streptomyces TaxID=2593676 RepID=UPI003529D36F